MSNDEIKYVFVCGLQRSGTTVLARNIAKLKNCTGFTNTGVIMDEGQYLQDVYPLEAPHLGPGKFGFAREAHLTEASPLLTQASASRLRRSWEPYWDSSKSIRIEKTPRNLLMTRFLQAAFGNAYFVVIKRHPVPVSLATRKWAGTHLHRLFDHWLLCHRIFDRDKKHLARLYELRYEDYVANPDRYNREIADFIGTEPSSSQPSEPIEDHNKKYFTQWAEMILDWPHRPYYRRIAPLYEKKSSAHGYSLLQPLREAGISLAEDTPARHAAGSLLRLAVDAYVSTGRRWPEPISKVNHLLRLVLPPLREPHPRQASQQQSEVATGGRH